jgi:hypothetical protein
MKRKRIYSIIIICFITLLSSANQNKNNCKDEAYWIAAKSNCTLQTPKSLSSDADLVPLNLFLFNL